MFILRILIGHQIRGKLVRKYRFHLPGWFSGKLESSNIIFCFNIVFTGLLHENAMYDKAVDYNPT
jgi:cytoskeletal protein CcmA (bactofilin family)